MFKEIFMECRAELFQKFDLQYLSTLEELKVWINVKNDDIVAAAEVQNVSISLRRVHVHQIILFKV